VNLEAPSHVKVLVVSSAQVFRKPHGFRGERAKVTHCPNKGVQKSRTASETEGVDCTAARK
jgi:hypothetical protein